MENIRTQFGDLLAIPFASLDDLSKKWGSRDEYTEQEWSEAGAYGIVNGARSGGVVTIDLDTKKDVTGTLHLRFLDQLKYELPDLYDEAYIEFTKSNGCHFIYKVEGECPAKTIPAKTMDTNGKTQALIEVLGEGQMTLVYPTKGYSYKSGELAELPTFSQGHHKQLMAICAQYNELQDAVPSERAPEEKTGQGRSGDIYNERVEPKEVVELMVANGWEIVKEYQGQYFLRRPDKDKGISATFNYDNRKQLIVFSTSTSFVAHHDDGTLIGYSPFQIMSKLKFKGSFAKCAKWLDQQGYKDDCKKMWADMRKAFEDGGESHMRKVIPMEYVQTLDDNDLVDFLDDIKHEFGGRAITKSYLKGLQRKANADNLEEDAIDDNSDSSCYKAMVNDYYGKFGLNEFKGGTVHIIKPIKDIVDNVPADGIPLTDRHESAIWLQMLNKYDQSFQRQTITTLVDLMALDFKYNPVQSKLASLVWDEKPRINNWLKDYCGADDSEEVSKMGRYFMIGAVARIMKAGTKMDNALILKSAKQGIGKSQLVNVLSYGYSVDNVGEIGSKDCSEKLQGAWIVELPELDNVKNASKERIKRWLSTTNDDEVQKYEKRVSARPRQCVFIGTTNDDALFGEEEFRRFWPVETTSIDLKGLRAMRDQLWAEAVHLYHNGELWYSEDPNEFVEYSERYREVHPFEDEIKTYCKDRDVVFTKELHLHIFGATGSSKATFSPSKMREYTPVLRRLGFKGGQKHNGRSGAWRKA